MFYFDVSHIAPLAPRFARVQPGQRPGLTDAGKRIFFAADPRRRYTSPVQFFNPGAVMIKTLVALFIACVALFTSFASADSLMSAEENKKCQTVVDALIKAGFPDGKGATVYAGKLAVSCTFDPGKTQPQLPSEASDTQMTSDTALVTYGYKFEGLHFLLADGSWLIGLRYHFTPGKNDKVDFSNAPEVDLSKLSSDADANPFDAERKAKKWLDGELPEQRKVIAAIMDRYVPVSQKLLLGSDEMAPAAILLSRAGWTDALDLSMVCADQRARHYWQLRPWTEAEFSFDPTGEYPQAKEAEQAWNVANPQHKLEEPDAALHRAMFRWCRAQMLVQNPEDGMLTLEVAALTTRAMVDAGDPQHLIPNINLISASNKLPVTPDEKASLADRLQSWEAQPRMPKMVVTGGHDGGNGASISTGFVAPAPAYDPKPADMDDLVKLLGDDRPSRFHDFVGGRTLGDNAWRALATLLKDDPRKLAKYPTDHPWTTEERHTAAIAVADWWKDHRTEYVEKK